MAQSAAMAVPVTVDIGKESVSFHPLGMAEWKQMELSLLHRRKERHINSAWDTTGALPDDLRRELVKEAVNEAKLMDLTPVDVKTQSQTNGIPDIDDNGNPVIVEVQMDAVNAWVEQTFEGKMFAVWLSIKKGRPDISEQEVSDLLMVGGARGLESAFNAMLTASGMNDQGNEDGPS